MKESQVSDRTWSDREYRTWWGGEVAKLRAREMGSELQVHNDPRQQQRAANQQTLLSVLCPVFLGGEPEGFRSG
jgi:hypothetical protein